MPRKKPRRKKNANQSNVTDVTETLEELSITATEATIPEPQPSTSRQPDIQFRSDFLSEHLILWPMPKLNVPCVYLHKPWPMEKTKDLAYLKKYLGKRAYDIKNKSLYLKFVIKSFNVHDFVTEYLIKKDMPFHTFGNPSFRLMKVVVRNLPMSTDLNLLQKLLLDAGIPVERINKMHVRNSERHTTMLVLIVLPHTNEGKRILLVSHILGTEVTLEPAELKTRQCHRCQRWGHAAKYCFGAAKCVKCGGNHYTRKCKKEPGQTPRCANCGGHHTANCKKCIFCPLSKKYKKKQIAKQKKLAAKVEQVKRIRETRSA